MMHSKDTAALQMPAEFSQPNDNQASNYLRWQECIVAGQHVAHLCFDAKCDAAPGKNEELLARAAYLVCGDNFSEDEMSWLVKYSAAQLGW